MKQKKVVVISDLHAGSRSGLTTEPKNKIQESLLSNYTELIDVWRREFGGFDGVIANGDLIDGKGKNDATQTEQDLLKQTNIASDLLKLWNADNYFLTYGTAFHVSNKEGIDYEDNIKTLLNSWKNNCAVIDDKYTNLKINNVVFNVKHYIGGSATPHGRGTAILRSQLWNIYKSVVNHGVKADIIIRSHLHYYMAIENNLSEMIITPCWQIPDTKYGRLCEGDVDLGAILYIINENGTWERYKALLSLHDIAIKDYSL